MAKTISTRLVEPAQNPPRRTSNLLECLECGASFSPEDGVEFCCTPCRKSFNNRRMTRGAAFYDLLMPWRIERKLGSAFHILTLICRLIVQYREEDTARRNGRRSWAKTSAVIERNPSLLAERLVAVTPKERIEIHE